MTPLKIHSFMSKQFQQLLTHLIDPTDSYLETSEETNADGNITYHANIHTPQRLILCEINDTIHLSVFGVGNSNNPKKLIDSFKTHIPNDPIGEQTVLMCARNIAEEALWKMSKPDGQNLLPK